MVHGQGSYPWSIPESEVLEFGGTSPENKQLSALIEGKMYQFPNRSCSSSLFNNEITERFEYKVHWNLIITLFLWSMVMRYQYLCFHASLHFSHRLFAISDSSKKIEKRRKNQVNSKIY